MGKRREPMSEGKKNIIASLIQEYDIKTAEDIQDALKDLLGSTIQAMLEAEMMSIWGMPRMNARKIQIPAMVRRVKLFAANMEKWRLAFHKTVRAHSSLK